MKKRTPEQIINANCMQEKSIENKEKELKKIHEAEQILLMNETLFPIVGIIIGIFMAISFSYFIVYVNWYNWTLRVSISILTITLFMYILRSLYLLRIGDKIIYN